MKNGERCSCGRIHTCGVKKTVIGENAVSALRGLAQDFRRVVYVADKNTEAVCGAAVRAQLAGLLAGEIVYPDEGFLVPNESAIKRLEAAAPADTDLLVGVGSGVIQDLCKYVSFMRKIPYFVVATAPSMDGYASSGAAMILGGMKVTVPAHVPQVILGDTEVLRNAPMEMIRAGYGDILGKFSCLNDWKLSALVNGEYLCPEIYQMTTEMLYRVRDLGPALQRRESEAVRELMEALVGVGIAMAYAGNSRPASGSEHHLSHFFEIVGILKKEPYFHHGVDVACSAVITQRLREKLLTFDAAPAAKPFDKEAWKAEIRRVYAGAAEGVIVLQEKLGWHETDKMPVYREKWEKIREVLRETPSSAEMVAYLDSAGLSLAEYENQYGEAKLADAVRYAMDLKDRYSVLWLYNALEV